MERWSLLFLPTCRGLSGTPRAAFTPEQDSALPRPQRATAPHSLESVRCMGGPGPGRRDSHLHPFLWTGWGCQQETEGPLAWRLHEGPGEEPTLCQLYPQGFAISSMFIGQRAVKQDLPTPGKGEKPSSAVGPSIQHRVQVCRRHCRSSPNKPPLRGRLSVVIGGQTGSTRIGCQQEGGLGHRVSWLTVRVRAPAQHWPH